MNRLLLSLIVAALIGSALVFKYHTTKISDTIYGTEYEEEEEEEARFHKPAAEYLKMLRSNWETGKIEPSDYYKAKYTIEHRARAKGKSTPDLKWMEMGPDNIGGRIRGILVPKNSSKVIFAGSVSGGLFKSTDGGNNWKRVSNFKENLAISSIAETKNGNIYVATGCSFERPDADGHSGFYGGGVYRSTNGGESFELVEGSSPDANSPTDDYAVWNEVQSDPNSDDKIWLGGNAGFFTCTNGKLEPVKDNGFPANYASIYDLAVSNDGSKIIVAVSTGTGIIRTYLSKDKGKTWNKTSGNNDDNIPESGISRIEYAISPDDANWIYASVIQADRLEGIYQSTNGGEKWNPIAKGGGAFDPFLIKSLDIGQGVYDNAITVAPGNKEKIFVGGINLYSWKQVVNDPPAGDWRQVAFGNGVPQRTVHSDIHAFAWGKNGELYIGTDGGIYISKDLGETFYPANRGLNVTQLYGITYSPNDLVIGGTQDNGTFYLKKNGATNKEAATILGGDGFDCEISQMNPNALFATLYYAQLTRSSDNGVNLDYNVVSERIRQKGTPGRNLGEFYTIIRLIENENDKDSKDTIQFIPKETMYPGDTIHYQSRTFKKPFKKILEDTLRVIHDIDILDEDSVILKDVILTTDSIEFDSLILTKDSLRIDTNIIDTVIIIGGDTLHPGDTLVSVDTVFHQGDTLFTNPDTVFHQGDTIQIKEVIFEAGDTIQINIVDTIGLIDPVQSILALGMNPLAGVWITREALHFNGEPEWWQIMGTGRPNGFTGRVTCMEFSKDGNMLFVGTNKGNLWRITGLDSAYSKKDVDITVTNSNTSKLKISKVASAQSVITGISTFRDNPAIVVYTVGGYGNNPSANHVWYSENVTDSIPTFTAIDGDLPEIPVYEVEIDRKNNNLIILGTEFGVWATDNGGKNWLQQGIETVGNVPVFDVRQQWREWNDLGTVKNQGAVYIGTHGRGIWKSGTLVAIEEQDFKEENNVANPLKIIPNPIDETSYVELKLNRSDKGEILIYNLNGSLLKRNKAVFHNGLNKVKLNGSDLSTGSYLIVIKTNGKIFSGKMSVVK